MSMLFASDSECNDCMLAVMQHLHATNVMVNGALTEKLNVYAELKNLSELHTSRSVSLTALRDLDQLLEKLVTFEFCSDGLCMYVIRQEFSMNEICVLLYTIYRILRLINSRLNYNEASQELIQPVPLLETRVSSIVWMYGEINNRMKTYLSIPKEEIQKELLLLLFRICDNFYIVQYFRGNIKNKIYEKMSATEDIAQLLPKNEQGEPDECCVCSVQKLVPDADVTILDACNHILCSPCALCWFSDHNTCPVCRATITFTASRAQLKNFKNQEAKFQEFISKQENRTL